MEFFILWLILILSINSKELMKKMDLQKNILNLQLIFSQIELHMD